MSERLPSLNALRAFVAVAAHESVSRAAHDLNLTHSAISHQIKLLQDELGVALFVREGRGLRLTAAGQRYAQRVDRAFAEVRAATRDLVSDRRRSLRLSCMPSFAANWLLPRLGGFISAHGDIDVEVQSTGRLADIHGGEVDVALRFGNGVYPGLHCELLMRDWHFPVCSPGFARTHALATVPASTEQEERLRVVDFATRLPELHVLRSDNEPWAPWFQAAGVAGIEPVRGPIFDDSSLMLRGAVAGQGLCLGRQSIATDDLRAGRLVRLFRAVSESPAAYYFVCRQEDLALPAIRAIHDWLLDQVANTPPLP